MSSFTEPSHWIHHKVEVAPSVVLHYTDIRPSAPIGHTLVLIHGYPETSYCWRKVAQRFADQGYRVILPDYRGAGGSNKPRDGYDKMTMGRDIHTLFRQHLGVEKAIAVGYDVGMQVAVSLAVQFEESLEGLVVFEAPIAGTSGFDKVTSEPDSAFHRVFHFFFHNAPDNLAEMLTEGREKQYISSFYSRLCYDPTFVSDADVNIYAAAFSQAGAMRAGFELYRAYLQDKYDLRAWLREHDKFRLPVLTLAGNHSGFKDIMEDQCNEFATDVEFKIIPHANHWIPEENPDGFMEVVSGWLKEKGFAGRV